MKNNSISFSELANFNDSNSCVMVALIINDEGEVDEINEYLANVLGFSKGKKIIGYNSERAEMYRSKKPIARISTYFEAFFCYFFKEKKGRY